MFQILFTFYRRFILVTGSISLLFCFSFWSLKGLYYVFILFWMKVITNLLIGLLFIVFSRDSTIFYNNLGYSSLKMYWGVMFLDLLIWFVMMAIVFLVK